MSIAFRKKDYHYDGDDDEDPERFVDEENAAYLDEEDFYNETPEPKEWVLALYNNLVGFTTQQTVEIFDKPDPFSFAEFLDSTGVKNVY